MNKPKFITRILGHPLFASVSLLISIALLHVWYVSQSGERSESFLWILPLFGGALFLKTISAASEVHRYRKWKENYEEVAFGSVAAQQLKNWRTFSASICVGVIIYALRPHVNHQDWLLAATLYGITVLVWLAKMVLSSRQKEQKSARQQQPKAPVAPLATAVAESKHVVSVALSVPRRSPTVSEATRSLPDYCQALLRQ